MDDRLKELLAHGREHYDAGEYGKAEALLSQIADEKVPFADVYNMLGVICHQKGRLSEARAMLEEALRLNPKYTEAALNLAVTYNDLGNYLEAKAVYQRATQTWRKESRQLDPFAKGKIANMHAQIGGAYHELGLFSDAVREYERALALCPGFNDIRIKLGTTLRDMGDLEAAGREFSAIKKENPLFVPALLQLGLTYYGLGRHQEAAGEWEEAVRLDPENKSAKMYLRMVQQSAAIVGDGGKQ